MDQGFKFLDLDGLEDYQERELLMHLNSFHCNPNVKFPWDFYEEQSRNIKDVTCLNAFAPSFKSALLESCETNGNFQEVSNACVDNFHMYYEQCNGGDMVKPSTSQLPNTKHEFAYVSPSFISEFNGNCTFIQHNQMQRVHTSEILNNHPNLHCNETAITDQELCSGKGSDIVEKDALTGKTLNHNLHKSDSISNSENSHLLSGFMIKSSTNSVDNVLVRANSNQSEDSIKPDVHFTEEKPFLQLNTYNEEENSNSVSCIQAEKALSECSSSNEGCSVPTVPRSFADVLKSKSEKKSSVTQHIFKSTNLITNNISHSSRETASQEKKAHVNEDRLAMALGKHLVEWHIELTNISLQPRGLINRSNWCYINATLQALLACSPFYSLLRNLPVGVGVERGPSATPVIDSMVKLSYEYVQLKDEQKDLQIGASFQPHSVYEMLGTLKSQCLKGLQEDAEEFLSFILNEMHEEMVVVIKNYEKQHNINCTVESICNGTNEISDGEEEWQVIGAKQRGMVTRKVAEHKTPISELLGGQIKSLLTIIGSKTSASVQPFFTLQLDIQPDSVNSVEEALDHMTVKELIHGYTCAKTKQEVEAFCRIMLQKLPPVLILHLKRFIYNRNGGCKKIMKQTEYPIVLEFKKDLFTPEIKRVKKQFIYKLFAVIYHDGVEAFIGHYVADIYHHATKNWVRCDDRNVTAITEAQMLSHSPPRVPYLLFYHVCDASQVK